MTTDELLEGAFSGAGQRIAQYIKRAAQDEQDAKRLEEEFIAMCNDEATQRAVADNWKASIGFRVAAMKACGVDDLHTMHFAAVSLADMLWAEFRKWVRR
jgi:hypothetical protein